MTAAGTAPDNDLVARWERLRTAATQAGALIIPGEVAGTGLLVELEPADSDVLVALLGRVSPALLYAAEERFDKDVYEAELLIIDTADRELAAPEEDVDPEDAEFLDAAAFEELSRQAQDAAQRARAASKAARDKIGELSAVVLAVVVGGVQHTVTLAAPWRETTVGALLDLEDVMAAWRNPPARQLSAAEQDASWARRAAERQEVARAHEQAVEQVGEQLLEALLADSAFRTTRAEPARWQRAQVLLKPLMTWPEMSQADRAALRQVARQAWERLSEDAAARRAEIAQHADDHSAALAARPDWTAATTIPGRRRAARAYLSSIDPLVDEAALADLLIRRAAALPGSSTGQEPLL